MLQPQNYVGITFICRVHNTSAMLSEALSTIPPHKVISPNSESRINKLKIIPGAVDGIGTYHAVTNLKKPHTGRIERYP